MNSIKKQKHYNNDFVEQIQVFVIELSVCFSLTKPEILAELITLITEEPPKNVELAQQYRHASIACEVLTSQLPMLNDRLSLDTVQMNRLCDFINRDPPLNPLLASYFSKTVEMLLERSTKQVCLQIYKTRVSFTSRLK